MTDPTHAAEPAKLPLPRPRMGMRRLLFGAAFALTFLAGGLVMSGRPTAAFAQAMSHAGMGVHAALARHGDMNAMSQAHIDHMLMTVDATPEQKARIGAILKTAMDAMGQAHHGLEAVHGDLHRLLLAPVVDRAALEQLRAAHIAALDRASKAMVGAMADAAEVLTPEQRARLAKEMGASHPDR